MLEGEAILVRIVVGDSAVNVISAYTPQVGLSESTKKQFWIDLDSMVGTMPISEKLLIVGYLNDHVGATLSFCLHFICIKKQFVFYKLAVYFLSSY